MDLGGAQRGAHGERGVLRDAGDDGAVCSGQGPRELHLGVVVAETPEHGKDVLGGRAGASRSEDHPFAATWEWSALLPQRHGIPRASQPVHDSRPWMCSTQPHVASLANSRPQRPHMSTVQRTQPDGSAADRLCTSVLPARYSLASCRTKTFPLSS